jgi:hypothetical protein
MTSLTTISRHIKQAAAVRELEQRATQAADAADHYTSADRATAEALEAADLLAEFTATEV